MIVFLNFEDWNPLKFKGKVSRHRLPSGQGDRQRGWEQLQTLRTLFNQGRSVMPRRARKTRTAISRRRLPPGKKEQQIGNQDTSPCI